MNQVMTKKSKSKNKVTSAIDSKETSDLEASGSVKNGKIAKSSPSTFNPASLPPKLGGVPGLGPSLAGIPGIVDDFLAPKFVKVLNLSDHGFEKKPPPSLEEYKATKESKDTNANKVEVKNEDSNPGVKKNKRKKSKPVKNTNNTSYDSEDGRELEVFSSNFNGNDFPDNSVQFSQVNAPGLSSKDASSLAQLARIRNSAFSRYEGNNIVLVNSDNDGPYPTTSCYDDYNYDYEGDDELVASGGGTSASRSDETFQDHDEDDDEDERVGSWSLSHADYDSKQQASSSVASSESEHTTSSLSTQASRNSSRSFPALTTCTTIWDGMNNNCEIKDCSKPATKKCSQCKTAFYCCEEHQRLDWKRHKNDCIPYRMDNRFGDDVSWAVAAKNIPQGQTIFTEKPLLVFPLAQPDNDFMNVMELRCMRKFTDKEALKGPRLGLEVSCAASKPACFGCLKSMEYCGGPKYFCSSCRLPLCSYKCYLDPFHQAAECQILSSQGGWMEDQHKCYHSLYMDIEIVRALQLECVDNSSWERFQQLNKNVRVEAYKGSEKYARFIENYRELVPISAKLSGYNEDLIGNCHAIITALSFRPNLKSTYKLIFATQILFAHDCIPNTFHYLEESHNGKVNAMSLVTKAASAILKKDIITIDFTPTPFLYYPLRRLLLKNVLSIDDCACKRCKTPGALYDYTAHVKCPRCKGTLCPENISFWRNSVWACMNCLEEFPYQVVHQITTNCRDELAMIVSQPRQIVVPALKQFIARRVDQDLDPGHSIIIQAWSFIETHLRCSLAAKRLSGPGPTYPENTVDEYRLLKSCCEVIEKHLDVVRPGICYERGCMQLNRYYIEIAISAKSFNLRLTKRKEYIQELMLTMKILQEALKIFQMYEGFNREVSFHIQEATSALVTTKAFIQQQIVTDSEDTKSKRTQAQAKAATLFKE